jgi:hypothetical protein
MMSFPSSLHSYGLTPVGWMVLLLVVAALIFWVCLKAFRN